MNCGVALSVAKPEPLCIARHETNSEAIPNLAMLIKVIVMFRLGKGFSINSEIGIRVRVL